MAQILPEEITSLSNLSTSSKTVCRILEQNLSDEWECHAALSGNNIVRFLITSPDLGVLVLCISNCSPDQFDSFSSDIPQLKQQYLDTVRQHLQKEYQLCNDDKSLKFPIGFGLIFTELSSDYANSATIGILSEFVLFNDELQGMTNSDTELEDRLFDMVEEFDFNELDDDELQIISDNIPSIHVALQKVKMETDEVAEKQIDLKRWWNSLDDEWKNIFMAHIGDGPLRNLKSLKKLSISDTQVSDLEPLRNLKSLEKLSMFLTRVSDLEPLSNLKRLETLDTFDTWVSDLKPLRNLKRLETLDISDTQVSDLKPLRNLKSLKHLDISDTQVSDLEPLRNLENLEWLTLSGMLVSDLEPLRNLKSLKHLDISRSRVSDLEPLRNLNKLRTLYSDFTPVSEALGITDINSFRKKYPLLDEHSEKQIDQKRWWNSLDDEWKNIFMKHIGDHSANIIKDSGHNHLESLGYKSTKYDIKNEDLKYYICTHQSRRYLVLLPIDELGMILFRRPWSVEDPDLKYNEIELLKTINELNASNYITCCHLEKSKGAPVIQAVLSNRYSKIDLDLFLEHFLNKTNEFYNTITDRKKYPLVDEYSEQQSADIIKDSGQDMLEDVGVAPFINHLEFLGYKSIEYDINEDQQYYICTHQSKRYLILLPLDELGMILFRYQWSVEDTDLIYKEIELLQTLNELNASNYITCCHLGESKNAVIQAVLSNRYSKIDFDLFLEHFLNKTKEFYNTITKILERRDGDEMLFGSALFEQR